MVWYCLWYCVFFFFFSSRRRHTRYWRDWSSDVCSSDLIERSGTWTHDGDVVALRPGEGLLGADAAFPVLHGPFGEDGTVQGLLELLDVPRSEERRVGKECRSRWSPYH